MTYVCYCDATSLLQQNTEIKDKCLQFFMTRVTHLALDSSEDKRLHDEFCLRNTLPLKAALLLMGFLTHNRQHETFRLAKKNFEDKHFCCFLHL